MRNPAMLAALFVLALLAVAPPAAAGRGTNLLPNGGFEKGMDGWTVNDESGTIKVEIDRKERAEGRVSAHVVKGKSEGLSNDRLQCELKRLPAGKKVLVSAKIKGKGLRNTWLKFFVYDAKDAVIVEECDIGRYSGTFGWKDVDQEFELPKEAVRAEVRLCMFLEGEAWLDDVQVVGDAAAAREAAPTKDEKAAPLPPDLRKWLDENAVKVKTLDLEGGFEDLRPLKEILKDARIVQLGENSHGDGACFEAKARLVRFLHEEMGFEVVAWESGLWECDRANDLLRKGDADGVVGAAIFGIWNTAPVRRLLRYMAGRAKTERPLLLAGVDCRWSGSLADGFLEECAEFLGKAGAGSKKDFEPLRRLQDLVREQGDDYAPPGKDLAAGLAAWKRVREAFDGAQAKLVEVHGEAETEFFSRCLDNWRDNEAFERSKGDKSLGTWGSSNLRDPAMAANLKWLAEVRHPGKRIVVWGASMHLARGVAGVDPGGNPKFYADYRNMGEGVHEAFGKEAYTIGFAAHGGECGSFGRRNPLAPPKEGSVEDLLHRYGEPVLFVDLRREGPFAKDLHMAPFAYGRAMHADWTKVLDGVVFIDRMTAAR
jgi:erythromycin esterase